MPVAFCSDRKPARKPETTGKCNLSQRDKPPLVAMGRKPKDSETT